MNKEEIKQAVNFFLKHEKDPEFKNITGHYFRQGQSYPFMSDESQIKYNKMLFE